jgi:thymidine kinase
MSEKISLSSHYTPSFKGSLEMIIGPMFAGKSTELLRRVQKHAISGKSCLYVKYAADTRYDTTCISTHDQLKREAHQVSKMSELGDIWMNYDVIGIDEGQFFPDIVDFCENAA